METVTLKLDRKHVALLKQQAKALGRSQGAIVRDLIGEHLARKKRPSLYDLTRDLCGSVRGPKNLSPPGLSRVMAATKILANTGPLMAYLSESDEHHCWALTTFGSFYEPVHTCEAVISPR